MRPHILRNGSDAKLDKKLIVQLLIENNIVSAELFATMKTNQDPAGLQSELKLPVEPLEAPLCFQTHRITQRGVTAILNHTCIL